MAPRPAEAQRRRPVREPEGRSVVVRGGFAPYWYYDPWYQRGWGYPYPPYGWTYPYYAYGDQLTSELRLAVTPRNAQVFVDGYLAGVVDNFDGVFQRLRVRPGAHEITLYLEGYRTVHQNLYLAPGSDQKITHTMQKLAAGESSEPPPQPSTAPAAGPPQAGGPPAAFTPPEGPGPGPASERPPNARFGTLSIRVLPADAGIFVDGERWAAPAGQDRVEVELAEGRHHVDVRKSGFAQYSEDVLIRRDATLRINVSLLHGSTGGSQPVGGTACEPEPSRPRW